MNSQDEDDLAELVATVERGIHPDPEDASMFRMIGFPPDSLLYRGDALELHRRLSLRLSQSALAESGHVPRSVAKLLDEFVRNSDTSDLATALAYLGAELSSPLERWTFVQELGFQSPCARFEVGPCVVVQNLDDVEQGLASLYAPMASDMRSPFIYTTVEARDQFSARILAIEAFAEAEAAVALLTGWTGAPDVRHLTVNSPVTHYSSGSAAIRQIQRIDASGNLWPGYHELSEALARLPEQRTDWEQRALAASRWFHVAKNSDWPSQSISALMSTLECLLVKSDDRGNKREPIAARTSDIGILSGRTRTDQVTWLEGLYQRRNDAVHAGVFHRDEIDAEALLVLVDAVVHWSIRHLDPTHRDSGGLPCTTIVEALAVH
jgi:hypothetical protein